MPPESHRQAEHLTQCIATSVESKFYSTQLPTWDNAEQRRTKIPFPIRLPHESFASEFVKAPEEFDVGRYTPENYPPQYRAHPVTVAKGRDSVPIGYFSDGVPHTTKDSFLVYYWSNTLTGRRYLMFAVRKSDLCQCGCKGECSIGELMRVLVWSFNALASGVHPEFNHYGEPFDFDDHRWALRGTPLADGRCGALCEMRADLLEIVEACGFTRWSNPENPCWLCHCTRDQLFDIPATVQLGVWAPKDAADFQLRALACRTTRIVTDRGTWQRLREALVIDGRKKGHSGRCLVRPFPELALSAGNRLLPEGQVRDVWELEHIDVPVHLTFFNAAGDQGLNSICPLFGVVGFSIESVQLDVMHILDLGVSQLLAAALFRTLLVENFTGCDFTHVELRNVYGLRQLNKRMWAYYKAHPRPRGEMSAIGKLTMKMLGKASQPRLKAKAAETRNLIPFCAQLVVEQEAKLGGRHGMLRMATSALAAVYQVMRSEETRHMSAAGLSELQRQMSRFLHYWKAWGGHMVYKHHAAWHIAQMAAIHGNPRFYWTYPDESENRAMKKVAQSMHAGPTFYTSFMQKVLPEVA